MDFLKTMKDLQQMISKEKNKVDIPNKKQKEYEDTLEEENIESQLGDIPYKQKDGYINGK